MTWSSPIESTDVEDMPVLTRRHTPPLVVRGRLITMDAALPEAEAMAISDGHVVAVGDTAAVTAAVPEGTAVLDLGERAVVPGLIDSHNHMLWTGLATVRADLSRARSIDELLDIVRQWALEQPRADWVVSSEGWEVADLCESRYPTRDELDRVCPDRPVCLPRGGHAAVVNSRALEAAGITAETVAPDGGVIERDGHGRLTGLLLESAKALVMDLVPQPTRAEHRSALQAIQQQYLAAGITRVVEPGLTPGEIASYAEVYAADELLVRATLMAVIDDPGDPVAAAERLLPTLTGTAWSDWLTSGGYKAFLDGGASLGTAWLREDYPGRAGYYGEQLIRQEDLVGLLAHTVEHELPIGIHAVGGAAIDAVLAGVGDIRMSHPDARPSGISLIHSYVWPSPDNMRTAAEHGVALASQPTMLERFTEQLERQFGAEGLAAAGPLRSWLDAGVTVGGGSDSPITPFDPIRGIWQAATRWSDHAGRQVAPEQCVSPLEALEMYTLGSAEIAGVSGKEGVLSPGARADWVALDRDPLTCPTDRLRDIAVDVTAVGGQVVHDVR